MRVKQDNHQVYFAGSTPYGLDGRPVSNLGEGACTITLAHTDVVVQRSFSNKPPAGFANFFDKIEHYVGLIAGPAMMLNGANPLTFRADPDVAGSSVFKFHDTLTSRAEIGDLAALFKDEVIAIIGLGGTGAYLLDFFVKTPVKEIRALMKIITMSTTPFDRPEKPEESELGRRKAEIYRNRYDNFREGLHIYQRYLDASSTEDLQGVTFAFVCVDKGTARAGIFDLLMSMSIPFIDVGMGLNRKQGALSGTIRATYYAADSANTIRDMQLAEETDAPDDVYHRTVQIAELNALNAGFAAIRYKQLRGFYVDDNAPYHLLMETGSLRTFAEAST